MDYLGKDMPKLGFGLMRLPEIDGKTDTEQVSAMVDMFLERGYKYFDTAYVYGDGASEYAARDCLVRRHPRDSFCLATKLAAWAGPKSKEEAERTFEVSLERTEAGYFDYYLLHNLGSDRTHFFEDYDLWNFVKKKKAEGLIRHVGFSFHDGPEALDAVLNAHGDVAEFVQLQINYADWNDPVVRAKECYEVARKHGKPIIIMEPVKGGNLANPNPTITSLFKSAEPDVSPSAWALRFAASLDGVITVLSGMSNLEQMKDNLNTADGFSSLCDKQKDVISKAADYFRNVKTVNCTSCEYCIKGCPVNIPINGIFWALRQYDVYNTMEDSKDTYLWHIHNEGKSSPRSCISCGKCEDVCPQHINIREEIKRAADIFED